MEQFVRIVEVQIWFINLDVPLAIIVEVQNVHK
jgi:hypothetical protein